MSIFIIVVVVVVVGCIAFIVSLLFAPYTINTECAFRRFKFSCQLNLSSFLNIFKLKFTLKENRKNLEFIICRQTISLNRFMKKKGKKEKPSEKVSKPIRNLKKLTEREQLKLIKKSFSALGLKNCKIKVIFGSSDPYVTGIVCAWVLPMLIYFDSVDFKPEFKEQSFTFFAEVIFPVYVYKIMIVIVSAVLRNRFQRFRSKGYN